LRQPRPGVPGDFHQRAIPGDGTGSDGQGLLTA
jgi:hypothetical protein